MDFFDPEKQKQHRYRLIAGYTVVGLVLLCASIILLYRAYGFGVDKQGRIIQNGLIFVSSRPDGADVYLNGKKYKDQTNTRIDTRAGQYLAELKRRGYHDWKRAITIEGGSVQRFDYPLLFPVDLKAEVTKQYQAAPGMSSESLDRRWLLVAMANTNTFDLYDLNAEVPAARQIEVSDEILAAGSTTKMWEAVEWADDNRHVVLKRSYEKPGQSGAEYILFDRENPGESQNLSVVLGFTPTRIELRNQDFNQYYLFDETAAQLFTATLDRPTPQPYQSGVLAFASEGDTVMYATAKDAPEGKALVRIRQRNDPTLTMRQVPLGSTYLFDLAVYSGDLYAAAGVASENRVPVYRDPIGKLRAQPNEPLAPTDILKVTSPNYVSFSANKRFVIAENGDRFAVYDAETDRGYAFQAKVAPDAPQTHATWMDGFHLMYVSGGKVAVFDYDGTNTQLLSASNPALLPNFDRNYRYLYTIDAQNALTRTALLTPEDL